MAILAHVYRAAAPRTGLPPRVGPRPQMVGGPRRHGERASGGTVCRVPGPSRVLSGGPPASAGVEVNQERALHLSRSSYHPSPANPSRSCLCQPDAKILHIGVRQQQGAAASDEPVCFCVDVNVPQLKSGVRVVRKRISPPGVLPWLDCSPLQQKRFVQISTSDVSALS